MYKSQKSCLQLDQSKDIKEPAEKWFWPPPPPLPEDEERENEVEEEAEEDQLLEVDEQLSILTGYLRGEYMYCLWCGCHFTDFEEMARHCPGDTREAHDE